MKSVFISHSWHDKALARRIAEAVQTFGGRVWLDEAEIKIGDSLVEKIRQRIDGIDYVIALLSNKSVSSEWVKKELDVAMNQEIAGRRVKVIPILATRCELPGFLEGKLYADMSTKKAYRASLPMLLDHLGVPPNKIAKVKGSDSPLRRSNAAWIRNLRDALTTEDEATKYRALKSAPTHKGKMLLSHLDVLEQLFQLAVSVGPTHVRCRAIEILASIEDAYFAYRFEPLLLDPVPQVVCAAVDAFAKLQATTNSRRVLDLMSTTVDSKVTITCLRFFSRVMVHERSDMLSFLSFCDRLSASPDRGVQFIIAKALVKQAYWYSDLVVPRLLSILSSSDHDATTVVLDGLSDFAGDFYVRSAKLRADLSDAILLCCESTNPSLAAHALVAAIVLADSFGGDKVRLAAWGKLQAASRWTALDFFEALGEFRLSAIFDSPLDVKSLISLVGNFDSEIDLKIEEALSEVGTPECLEYLSTRAYRPKGWSKVYVLRNAFDLPHWTPALTDMITSASQELPEYTLPEGEAFASLALYKAGVLGFAELLARFPRKFDKTYRKDDHERLAVCLKQLIKDGNASERKTITRLANSLSQENEE